MPQKMYPQWQQTWEKRAEEIDQHIVDCCTGPGVKLEDVTEKVRVRVSNFLEQEGQAPLERTDPALSSNDEFQQKVQERINYLQRQGRIRKENLPKPS